MKRFFYLLSLVAFTSCYQSADESALESSSIVNFRLNAFGADQEAMTRAGEMVPGHLLVIDCCNGKNDVFTQESLAEVPLPLAWGQHEIYFVAASAVWSSYDANALTVTWPSTRQGMQYVWGKKISLEVSASTGSQEVTLPIIGADVKISTLDNLPSNMGDFKIEAPDVCRGLKLSDMSGFVTSTPVSYSIACKAYAGANTFITNIYTLVPNTNSVGDITLTAYTSETTPAEITSLTLSDVPVTKGYVSSYTGYFFTDGVALSFSYEDEWKSTNQYSF